MTYGWPDGLRDVTAQAERIGEERGWADVPPPAGPEDYGLPGDGRAVDDQQPVSRKTGQKQGVQWPGPLDLTELAQREPDPPAFIVPDWGPAGYAWLLAGHGGAGKSSIGLHLSVCMALGLPWCGLQVERRRVLVLACEDRANVLHWRLRRICDHLNVDMAELAGWLHVVDLVGHDTTLWPPAPDNPTSQTPAYDALAAQMETTGADVVIVDGVTDAFAGNENDRAEVKAFVNALLALIDESKGAILLLGHVNKPAAAGPGSSEGYSGSTAWHNAVRARWYLYPETSKGEEDERPQSTGRLTLELQKSNLGRADQAIKFRWDEAAHLFAAEEVETGTVASIKDQVERQSIMDAFAECQAKGIPVPAATTGPRTAYHVLRASGVLSDKLTTDTKANRRRFWRRIEELRAMRSIRDGSIRRADRQIVPTDVV